MTGSCPTTSGDVADAVADAARAGQRLTIQGGGSKRDIGAPVEGTRTLDMRGFIGIVDYDPAELVLTARAGTPLAQVQAAVAAQGQMLAFEPFDPGPIFGRPAGAATLGGVIGAATAGSQRLSQGGVRDHLLGFEAVSGRGEAFVAGAKVVKNVTGYDLSKLVCGSWGRLVALTQVTLKVLPAPRTRLTKLVEGLDPVQAHRAMARALGSQAEVAAAAHIPAELRDGAPAVTALRLQGFGPSVAARSAMLDRLLGEHGRVRDASEDEAQALWSDLRTLTPFGATKPIWRVSVPARGGPDVVAALAPLRAQWMFDWGAGLVWAAFEGDLAVVRSAAEAAGGHALLMRGPATLRATTPTLHPQPPGVAALEARIRRAFDPSGVFETGRF